MPNYFEISSVIFDKKIFSSFFILVAMATGILHGLKISEDHPWIIPVKFREIPPSGFRRK